MTNKEMILNELNNDIKKLAELLIRIEDNTGWDEISTYSYITSDNNVFIDDYECALRHEIEWLNSKK
mgnify:CR=1 FL=1